MCFAPNKHLFIAGYVEGRFWGDSKREIFPWKGQRWFRDEFELDPVINDLQRVIGTFNRAVVVSTVQYIWERRCPQYTYAFQLLGNSQWSFVGYQNDRFYFEFAVGNFWSYIFMTAYKCRGLYNIHNRRLMTILIINKLT